MNYILQLSSYLVANMPFHKDSEAATINKSATSTGFYSSLYVKKRANAAILKI
jgi:hypothetical protein